MASLKLVGDKQQQFDCKSKSTTITQVTSQKKIARPQSQRPTKALNYLGSKKVIKHKIISSQSVFKNPNLMNTIASSQRVPAYSN
jgi:hypothetical protein